MDFLEAYPDILGQRFTCPSVNSCLDSSGEHIVSLFPSRHDPWGPLCSRGGLWRALRSSSTSLGVMLGQALTLPKDEEGEALGPVPASPGGWAPAHWPPL